MRNANNTEYTQTANNSNSRRASEWERKKPISPKILISILWSPNDANANTHTLYGADGMVVRPIALYKNRELFVFHLREQGKRNTHTREDEDERMACMCMCYHFHVWIVEHRIHIAAQHGREIDLIVAKHLISIRIRPHTQSYMHYIRGNYAAPEQNRRTKKRKIEYATTMRISCFVLQMFDTHTHQPHEHAKHFERGEFAQWATTCGDIWTQFAATRIATTQPWQIEAEIMFTLCRKIHLEKSNNHFNFIWARIFVLSLRGRRPVSQSIRCCCHALVIFALWPWACVSVFARNVIFGFTSKQIEWHICLWRGVIIYAWEIVHLAERTDSDSLSRAHSRWWLSSSKVLISVGLVLREDKNSSNQVASRIIER